MGSKRRTKDIRTIVHEPTGVGVQLQLDTQDLLYHATYAGRKYSSKNGDEVVSAVLDAIVQSLQVEWIPVIEVRPYIQDSAGVPAENVFAFRLDRVYVAEFPDGSYKTVQWNATSGQRFSWSRDFRWNKQKGGAFSPPCMLQEYHEVKYYLSYSDATYEGLQLILGQIRKLRAQFLSILGSEEGTDWLSRLTTAAPALGLLSFPDISASGDGKP